MTNVVRAARTSQSGIASSRFITKDIKLYEYEDSEGAMFVTASQFGERPAGQYEVQWHTDELRPKFDTLGGSIADTTTTTVTVSNGAYFTIGNMIQVTSTKEAMMITNVSGNTLTVVRSWGPIAAQTASSGAEVKILPTHYGENARLQAARSTTEVKYTNQTAIWREPLEISETLRAIGEQGGLHYGNDLDYQRRKMMRTHKRDINESCLFSQRGGSGTQRSISGQLEFIQTYGSNRVNSTSAVTYSVFNTAGKVALRYCDSKRMLVICGPQFAQIVSEWALGLSASNPAAKIDMQVGATKFGLRIMDIKTAHGDFRLLIDNAFEGTEYSKYALMLSSDEGKRPEWAYLRKTQVQKNRQEADQDGYIEEVLTEGTLIGGNPDTSYLFTNAQTSS